MEILSMNEQAPKNEKVIVQIVSLKVRFWLSLLMLGVNIYDFLGLAGVVATHSSHVWRPYITTSTGFHVFLKTFQQPKKLK